MNTFSWKLSFKIPNSFVVLALTFRRLFLGPDGEMDIAYLVLVIIQGGIELAETSLTGGSLVKNVCSGLAYFFRLVCAPRLSFWSN